MKKILKNILIWIILVVLSFSILFTAEYMFQNGGIIQAISYKISTYEKPYVYNLESSELQEVIKQNQEFTDKVFEQYNESTNKKTIELKELYKQYPVGTVWLLNQIASANTISNLYIVCLVLGVVIGTIILLLSIFIQENKNKKLNKEVENKKDKEEQGSK